MTEKTPEEMAEKEVNKQLGKSIARRQLEIKQYQAKIKKLEKEIEKIKSGELVEGESSPSSISVSLILDESGSMGSCKQETINGFNEYIQSLRKQNVKFALTKFSDDCKIVYNAKDIKDVKELNEVDYQPNGMTALYDAIGNTISMVKSEDKVLIVILTDGDENASEEYKKETIAKLIKEKEKKGWTFVYLGANQDAMLNAEKFGLRCNTMGFSTSEMKDTFRKLSRGTATLCSSGKRGSKNFWK